MFVKPAEGRAPRDPRTLLRIPREGVEVSEHDPSFAALRFYGDVVECEPPAPVSEVAAERAEAEEHLARQAQIGSDAASGAGAVVPAELVAPAPAAEEH